MLKRPVRNIPSMSNKKFGDRMVTTIQITDYLKSGNWMFPVTEGPITVYVLYNQMFDWNLFSTNT